jgi:hypothetical protein
MDGVRNRSVSDTVRATHASSLLFLLKGRNLNTFVPHDPGRSKISRHSRKCYLVYAGTKKFLPQQQETKECQP